MAFVKALSPKALERLLPLLVALKTFMPWLSCTSNALLPLKESRKLVEKLRQLQKKVYLYLIKYARRLLQQISPVMKL